MSYEEMLHELIFLTTWQRKMMIDYGDIYQKLDE